MRITFDTNTFADVISPNSSQRPTGATDGAKVQEAVKNGSVDGFFCETLITLEGIKNADRSMVFGSTANNTIYRHGIADDGAGITYIDIRSEQLARRQLDHRQANRFLAAFDLGMKLLGAPRAGMVRVDDPDGHRYLPDSDEEELGRRLERYFDIASAIEARGLGCAQARTIADQIQIAIGGIEPFISYLGKPRTSAEQQDINRSIAEWSDGDSVSAHYGYGIEFFCSEDFGKSSKKPSVLDPENRKWLSDTFGIQFITLAELARIMPT